MKDLQSIIEHYRSTTIAFLPSSHTRSLKIKAFQITTSNSGNFKVLCKISLTNFIPFAFYWIRHQIYIIHIKSSYQIPPIKASRVTTSNSWNFKILCNISLTNFVSSASNQIRHHIYIIHIKSSYEIPPDQGFQGHYFKLGELQGNMQHFSHKFNSFRF